MTENEILLRIKDIFYDTLNVQKDLIHNGIKQIDISEWDSLGHLKLFLTLEQVFGISFSIDEIPQLDSIDKIINKINEIMDKNK